MRLRGWASLALASLISGPLAAETRPRYGGTLTVELSAAWPTLDAANVRSALTIPIAETLVFVSQHDAIEPALAVAWQHDPDFKRWRFSLRPKVTFHDGEPLNAANAAPSLLAALKQKYPDVSIEAGGQALLIKSDRAIPDLLDQLALPAAAIVRKSDNNPMVGTGPFRITTWEPGRRLTLAAFEDYWGGRPYLDTLAIEFATSRSRAELFDIPAGPTRRILPEGLETWSSSPRTLLAIVADQPSPLIEALALAIDRTPIANVLAQHKADAAYGLLPQWLSGYAFLFQYAPDVARAKQIVAAAHAGALTLGYPPNDPFLRSVAERVALNARDAGIIVQPTPAASANLRLVEWPLESKDATAELNRLGLRIGAPANEYPSSPEAAYEFERSLLEVHRIIPLIYLRETYGMAPRVHFQNSAADPFTLHLEDAWLTP